MPETTVVAETYTRRVLGSLSELWGSLFACASVAPILIAQRNHLALEGSNCLCDRDLCRGSLRIPQRSRSRRLFLVGVPEEAESHYIAVVWAPQVA